MKIKPISANEAKYMVENNKIRSAAWRHSSADILNKLLGVEMPANRIQFEQKLYQKAIVFKLNGCPPEGKSLTIKEIEEIGYKFLLLTRLS